MKIVVEIDRLVLDGMHVGAGDAARIRDAVTAELTRMLASGEIASGQTGRGRMEPGAVPIVLGERLALPRGASAGRTGKEIARSVYSAITSVHPRFARDGRGGRR
jgi:hypothetical protein